MSELTDALTSTEPGRKKTHMRPTPPRPPRLVQRRFIAAEAAQIAKQYRAGQTMNQLASAYGVHRRTVAHCLQRQAVPIRQVGLPPEHLEQAAGLYRAGWSLARIGDEYGTTDMTAGPWLFMARRLSPAVARVER